MYIFFHSYTISARLKAVQGIESYTSSWPKTLNSKEVGRKAYKCSLRNSLFQLYLSQLNKPQHIFYTFMGNTRSNLEIGPCGKQGKQYCGKSRITVINTLFLAGKDHLPKNIIISPASFATRHAQADEANSANKI